MAHIKHQNIVMKVVFFFSHLRMLQVEKSIGIMQNVFPLIYMKSCMLG